MNVLVGCHFITRVTKSFNILSNKVILSMKVYAPKIMDMDFLKFIDAFEGIQGYIRLKKAK